MLAVPLAVLLLFPPFVPPVPWRWVTDRVPWQVAVRVPWSHPVARVTAGACGSDAIQAVLSHESQGTHSYALDVFGHGWVGGGGPIEPVGSVSGTFRLLSPRSGLFTPEGAREGARMRRVGAGAGCMA